METYGNLEALEVAYDAAIARGAEKIYHLGDLGGYAPFVNEVVEFLIRHNIEGVQGNYDEAVAFDRGYCGCKAEDPLQDAMAVSGSEWTKRHVTPRTKNYLRTLPLEISFSCEGRQVKIYHAAPVSNTLYWYEEREDRFFMGMARLACTDIIGRRACADIIIYGHTHLSYRKDIDGKTFINAGSIGKQEDGDPRTCVTVVEIRAGMVNVEFLRLKYDVEKTAAAIVKSGLPVYFAERLLQGV